MRVLLLTFYYPADLSAGSFRAKALVDALRRQGGDDLSIDVVTTVPNRYHTHKEQARTPRGTGQSDDHALAAISASQRAGRSGSRLPRLRAPCARRNARQAVGHCRGHVLSPDDRCTRCSDRAPLRSAPLSGHPRSVHRHHGGPAVRLGTQARRSRFPYVGATDFPGRRSDQPRFSGLSRTRCRRGSRPILQPLHQWHR